MIEDYARIIRENERAISEIHENFRRKVDALIKEFHGDYPCFSVDRINVCTGETLPHRKHYLGVTVDISLQPNFPVLSGPNSQAEG